MLPIPGEEIAAGDWSPDYGTVEEVTPHKDGTYHVKFVNGKEIDLDADEDIFVNQGGRFDR